MRSTEKTENYLHITDKSEQGGRALVVASQTVGVLAECRPPRRPFPFVSGQSFLFPMPVAYGHLVIPLPLSVRVFRLELITTSSTRRANQEEKNIIKKTIMSVAAKRRGRYSTETVGEIETRPFGNDSVATAGLLPWLTHGR